MRILALESATAACSAATWVDGAVVAAERTELARGHAETLLPMVERVCAAARLKPGDVDRLAVTVGPGHFTALRVGLATARGLALATGRPLVGVTTLAALAAAVPPERRRDAIVIVALDSKRAEPYLQSFASSLTPLDTPVARLVADYAATLSASESSRRYVIAGDAAESLAAVLRDRGRDVDVLASLRHPDAVTVAALAAAAPLPSLLPAPLYIHPVQTTTPSKAALSVSS